MRARKRVATVVRFLAFQHRRCNQDLMRSAVLLVLAALCVSSPAAPTALAKGSAKPEAKDLTVIAVEIRHDGQVVSRPTIHAEIGSSAGIRHAVEIDGEPLELDVDIRIDRDKRQPGRLVGKFVYRLPDETVAVTERWRSKRSVEHVAGPFTIALDLSAAR